MKNIFSIFIIIVSFLSFLFFVKPKYVELKALEKKKQQLEEVSVNARRLQELRDSLLEKQKSFSKVDLNRLERLLPDSVDNVKLIIELQNIASRYGLSIQSANSEKDDNNSKLSSKKKFSKKVDFDVTSKDYGTLTLNFTIKGGYQSFLSFLKDIEDNIRITDVKKLEISIGNSEEADDYQFDIALDTYWLKDNI